MTDTCYTSDCGNCRGFRRTVGELTRKLDESGRRADSLESLWATARDTANKEYERAEMAEAKVQALEPFGERVAELEAQLAEVTRERDRLARGYRMMRDGPGKRADGDANLQEECDAIVGSPGEWHKPSVDDDGVHLP